MSKQKFSNNPLLFDTTTGRICGVKHPDNSEEMLVLMAESSGTPVDGVKAALTSDMTVANSDVTLTAVDYGLNGNFINVTYTDPGAASQDLAVAVSGYNITVSLATNSGASITSTSALVAAAINAHSLAKLLVVATYEGTGAGVVNALAKANLSGGVDVTPGVAGSSMMVSADATKIYIKATEQTWIKLIDKCLTEKTPVNAVAASGTLTVTSGGSKIVNNNQVTIDTKTYTFKSALTPTEGEVLIGANDTAALLNLKDAINRDTPGTKDGVKYKCAAAHTTVTATASAATTCSISAKTKGVAGNSISTTETGADTSFGNTTLTGGIDGTVGIANEICADGSYLYHCITTNTIADANWRRVDLGSAF